MTSPNGYRTLADVHSPLWFLPHIAVISLRPNMVLSGDSVQTVQLGKLTVVYSTKVIRNASMKGNWLVGI